VSKVPSAPGLRMIGVSLPDVSDWKEELPRGQWAQFFGALSRRMEVVDVIQPELSRAQRYANFARNFHPRGVRWRARAGFSPALAAKHTDLVQRALSRYAGAYDIVVQLQTLCAPGRDRGGAPYVIYTDNTMALTRRLNPLGYGSRVSPATASWWMRFEAEVCQAALAVFTYSEFTRASVIDDYRCSPERVVAVGAGANQLLESVDGKDYSAPLALFVGKDFAQKGGPTLLEAWTRVHEHLPAAELVIAGPERPPATLPQGVRWVGWVEREELAQLYRSASLFVMPSLFDAYGLVFLEAMGHGLPCIGTNLCAMPEIIEEGVTGRLVPRGESEPLAQALIDLLSDPLRRATMGRAAHERVLAQHRWSDVAERVFTRLESTLAAPTSR
jgi:glycosyltransferase involved in cell wall biosynthesis